MKINFPSLFQTPLQKYKFFLIYGNDEEVFERTLFFLQRKLGANFVTKIEEELRTTSYQQISLFQENVPSITLVPNVTDKVLPLLESLKEGIYVFTSQKARAQSKLVTFFSQSSTSLAIAAYAAPLSSSEFEFLTHEMNLPASFKGSLFKAYQSDCGGLLSTLDKIRLYGDLQEEDYSHFLHPSPLHEESGQLIHAFLLKNIKEALAGFSKVNKTELIPLLRGLSRSFQTLLNLLSIKAAGKVISWTTLTPPIFFKEQPLYERALSQWKEKEVLRFLETLLSAEQDVKFSALSFTALERRLLHCLKS
jgi:DNA polymerase III delta subunit